MTARSAAPSFEPCRATPESPPQARRPTAQAALTMTPTLFRKLVGHMHVLLQPSFTESFNVVTADGIAEGVASVVSDAIDWTPERWRAHADDAGDVARVAEYLLRNPHAVEDGRRALREYTEDGLARWVDFLNPATSSRLHSPFLRRLIRRGRVSYAVRD